MSNQISSSEICMFSVHGIFHSVNFHNNKVHKSFAHGSQYLFLLLCGKEIIEKHCSAVNIQMLLFERSCLWHKVNEREKKLGKLEIAMAFSVFS